MSTTNVNIISLGEMTSHGYKYVGIGKTYKVCKGSCLILRGRKDKNIFYLEGQSMWEMPKDSKVKMESENIEVFGNLAQGRICCL